jgi:hypothetical protein
MMQRDWYDSGMMQRDWYDSGMMQRDWYDSGMMQSTEETRIKNCILTEKPKGKRPLRRLRCEDNIKMDLEETIC